MERLSAAEARRVVLGAQGFAVARPSGVSAARLRRTIDRLNLHQIDSVNILARAHYLPAFSRLGPYDRTLLDRDAWGPLRRRHLFEYWAHEASLLPLDRHPLLRWRMAAIDRGEAGWKSLRRFAAEDRPVAMAMLRRIETDRPLAVSDLKEGRNQPGWWAWGTGKQALEWLFAAGHLTTATRRNSFERVYDLPSRVIPQAILALPTPDMLTAQRLLIEQSARALGIATAPELRDYFRLRPEESGPAIAALVEEGVLLPVQVEGWSRPAFLHRDARAPRQMTGAALLSPFDPLIWQRDRTERLFGFHYRIEIYTPAAKRVHGYYVLPFLLGDRLVARTDLKADRAAGRLLVQSIHLEPGAPAGTRDALETELRTLAAWLTLDRLVLPG